MSLVGVPTLTSQCIHIRATLLRLLTSLICVMNDKEHCEDFMYKELPQIHLWHEPFSPQSLSCWGTVNFNLKTSVKELKWCRSCRQVMTDWLSVSGSEWSSSGQLAVQRCTADVILRCPSCTVCGCFVHAQSDAVGPVCPRAHCLALRAFSERGSLCWFSYNDALQRWDLFFSPKERRRSLIPVYSRRSWCTQNRFQVPRITFSVCAFKVSVIALRALCH